ncbi:hypothetical protein DOS74_05645 [Staphylococcus felis]|uniref:Sigma-70 family RNA polymerase sigma factor n=1 Tax=Staphylococcus felis TaxID=46127 RepID=A0AAX1RTM6_9STAP|nr:hypothetical protein DOS59_06365 [Staphylococcus felis]REH82054.1 hypothetical protein DOS56_08850 [Staphylococcus felis]REH83497.1 hypothetical protein DOS63_08265 [Staphylococcus felis]REI01331.1 hypothetical protein DOS64_04180 [Staphylococcus felis]REI16316.1 hypothetical protein DOS74_05645 [Staphylococcus felis]
MPQSFRCAIKIMTGPKTKNEEIYLSFNKVYQKYNKYIHYLLNQYHIRYNYDDYYQQLLIRLWTLTKTYHSIKSQNKDAYFKYRLKYHLIDLLRNASKQPLHVDLITIENHTSYTALTDDDLLLHQLLTRLPPSHRLWLNLYLAGYRQYEIQNQMNKSATTIKKYKKETLYFLRQMIQK